MSALPMSSARARWFPPTVAVLAIAAAIATLYLRAELRGAIDDRSERALTSHAGLAREIAARGPIDGRALAVIAAATGDRVQLLDASGRTTLDSAGPSAVDLAGRPEVAAVRRDPEALGSTSDGVSAAVAFATPQGILRLSAPLASDDPAVERLVTEVGFGGAFGLALAIAAAWLGWWRSARAARRLVEAASAAARGEGARVHTADDDLGEVAITIDTLRERSTSLSSALAGERALVASVLATLAQGVVVLDAERRITALNDAARRLLDVPSGGIGDGFLDRVRAPALVALVQTPYTRNAGDVDLPNGTRLTARIAPLDGVAATGSDRRGALLVLDDVTTVRRLETMRKDFVANVSHELRTPVSIIRANAETLKGGAMDDPRFSHKLVDGLHRNAERLARILTDLLDLSRLDAGHYRIELSPMDIAKVAAQAALAVEPEAQAKSIAISADVSDDLFAQGDPKALDQVLVNLLENAVKYTPAGGHVWLTARAAKDRVVIEVTDDGPGIAPRHRERIFERFYRVDPGRSREVGGTGLGLAIVKHLVESMGGSVGVAGNEPHGSRFWVELGGSPAALKSSDTIASS
ncbi:MAG: histidine kinase [Deltaproteobacteria bacterium]|nr:histidine kinase [Deltaproteobacteria bacterium]